MVNEATANIPEWDTVNRSWWKDDKPYCLTVL